MTLSQTVITTIIAVCSLTTLAAAEPPTLAEHEPFIADLVITNPYDKAVRIRDIDQSCTCEKLELADEFLLPGASTTLHIQVDNTNRSGSKDHSFLAYLSDPDLEPIEVRAQWHVAPNVAIDLIPPTGPFDQRPANQMAHDIYMILEARRPEGIPQMQRYFRLFTENPPDGGLAIEGFDYAGDLWTFASRQNDDGSWLVRLAGNPDSAGAHGAHEETVDIRTNHPHKPVVTVHLKTSIDPLVGTADYEDPWYRYR